jgi:predicted ribonuclease toxin of YeeF-YezG toxin-antitoxin module
VSEIDRIIEQKIKQLKRDLDDISYTDLRPFVEQELKTSVVKNIYGRPESDYDRTGMMYNSITGFARKSNDDLEVYAIMNMENTNPRHTSWVKPYGTSNNGTEIRKPGDLYDAHHIIENKFGGNNEWWNMHPAKFPDEHQRGIHGAGSPARELFK